VGQIIAILCHIDLVSFKIVRCLIFDMTHSAK